MNKAQKTHYDWISQLSMAGWDVSREDAIKFNGGSETGIHIHAKTATCQILKNHGYRVNTEVCHPERGEIDVVAIPTQDGQLPFAVEIETSPTQDVIDDKLSRYHDGTPFVECYIINASELPFDIIELKNYIAGELGLNP